MSELKFIPLPSPHSWSDDEIERCAREFSQRMRLRRTVRDFCDRPVAREVIEQCLACAGSAPSGANLQPWHFVAISDAAVKRQIRDRAEHEEHEFYTKRAPQEWLDALAPIGTDWHKPFLETAPWLIAIFSQPHRTLPDGRRLHHYYASESVGIATGLLLAALHSCGLAALTHTPSPMAFLNRILDRPSYEKPFLLLVVGHAAEGACVPDLDRKSLEEISTFLV